MNSPLDLRRLSHAEKDTLIAALTVRLDAALVVIAEQERRIEALEARLAALTVPPKTPDNASKPPSQGQKQDCPTRWPSSAAQGTPWRGPDAASEPRPHRRITSECVPELHGTVPR